MILASREYVITVLFYRVDFWKNIQELLRGFWVDRFEAFLARSTQHQPGVKDSMPMITMVSGNQVIV